MKLPSKYQIDEDVEIRLSSKEDGSGLLTPISGVICIRAVHFYASEIRYDILILLPDDTSTIMRDISERLIYKKQ